MTNDTAPALADFLLARIEEDEDAVEGVNRGMWNSRVALLPPDLYGLISRQHPTRVLAECEAKRRIVELSWHHLGDGEYGWGMEEAKRQILALLALPYSDHPDYRDEWRP